MEKAIKAAFAAFEYLLRIAVGFDKATQMLNGVAGLADLLARQQALCPGRIGRSELSIYPCIKMGM